jgi:uncharacterized delta-60 repeat protein
MPSSFRFFAFFFAFAIARASVLSGLVFASAAHAATDQPGTLDTSFNGTGKLVTPVGTGEDRVTAALMQADGRIVLTGYCSNGNNYDFCASRYLPTGLLDTSFNGTGTLLTSLGAGHDQANSALLQPDGRLVLAGTCYSPAVSICAARYLPSGMLDASFNSTGVLITPETIIREGHGYAALLQPDGKIVLAGSCSNGGGTGFCAVRYLPTGALDTSLNGTGTLVTRIGPSSDYASSALLQPDGKIVLAGYCYNGANYDFCAARYLPTGALDPSFNGTGTIITAVGASHDYANAALLQPDGKIVLTGGCDNGSNTGFCVVRYLPTGSLDTGFNGTGKLITPIGLSGDVANAALLQPDGRIVLAGRCHNGTTNDFCAARLLPIGALDTSFNGTGKLTTPVGAAYAIAYAALLQPDGKIVLAGYCSNGSNSDFCAARYDSGPFGFQNCKPDLDGDGLFLATTDALIYTRIALGVTGNAVIGGITFAPNATRNTWPLIRDFLVTQCGMSLVQ